MTTHILYHRSKGSSLVELIISIALIAVVLVFLVKLLVDVNDQENNSTYAKKNQVNRAEILRVISNDLNVKTIKGINDDGSTVDNLVINFLFDDGTSSKISANEDSFKYTTSDGVNRKWTIEDASLYTKNASVNFSADANIYTLIIDIEIHTVNDKNKLGSNNTLDDIVISYIGDVSDYNTMISCLGDAC